MRKKRTPIMLALAGLIASLMTFVSSGTAVAAESIPELQWSAKEVNRYAPTTVTSPNGSVTVSCPSGQQPHTNLKTYSSTGQVIRDLPATQMIDGVPNCIESPAVDKNGDLYGMAAGYNSSGSWAVGTNLLAYSGNTMKWKYPTGCTSSAKTPTVGADGNIYAISNTDGKRLIGLTPEVEPGTTQPKKVLDIPLSGSGVCTGDLYATKDGIVFIRDMRPTFYTYSGQNLGMASSGLVYDETQINTAGRFFYDTYTASGSLRSVKITAFEGVTQKVAWERTASADGAYVYGADLRSTPDGGVLALLDEKKLVGGVQTSERVRTLVKLNSTGNKLWSKTLPNETASGSTFETGGSFVTDSNGNAAVVRNGTVNVNGKTGKGVSIGVFDGNGNAVYDKVMHGNYDSAAGPTYGFSNMSEPALWTDTLYLKVQCSGSCASYLETKLYPIKVTGLGLDYPRGEVLAREKRPSTPYLALGDSFSAGEGVEPFEAGTNVSDVNECHRSDYAYARVISGSSPKIPALGVQGFRACSGAVTENIRYGPQWNEPGAQLDLPAWPDTTTQLVTLTIGGNDIGFGDFAKACIYWSCAKDSGEYSTSLNAINNTLPGKLVETYKEILQRTPNAKIYVLGYPHVIADKKDGDANDARCSYMYGPHSSGNEWADVEAARDIVTKLNKAISDNIGAVRALNTDYSQRLQYVPLDGPDSPFNGHEICGSGTSWFQNVDQAANNPNYVFHPNKLGQELGYAAAAAAAINAG